jgi:hypothetical protein
MECRSLMCFFFFRRAAARAWKAAVRTAALIAFPPLIPSDDSGPGQLIQHLHVTTHCAFWALAGGERLVSMEGARRWQSRGGTDRAVGVHKLIWKAEQ